MTGAGSSDHPVFGASPDLPALEELVGRVEASDARLGGTRLVCIDGPAGSGKTTLGTALADRTQAALVHLDDLYEGWTGLGGVWVRLEEQVLRPVATGGTASYQRYDWLLGRFAEWVPVPAAPVLVVEGCGSAPRAVDPWASLVVFVEAPAEERLARGLSRDGEAFRPQWLRWMELEAVEHRHEDTRARADVLVDGMTGRVVARRAQGRGGER